MTKLTMKRFTIAAAAAVLAVAVPSAAQADVASFDGSTVRI